MFSIFIGTLFSNTFLVYIQDNIGFAIGYVIPTAGLAAAIGVLLTGTPLYRHRLPSGSPFNRMLQVAMAAMRKWNVVVPNDPKELHELGPEKYGKSSRSRIDHTNSLRFLDKAAVDAGPSSPGMLCPVTQVEETKQMIKMIPVLLVSFIPSTNIAQISTLFTKQGTSLDRRMGSHFEIPPASLAAFVTIFMLISLVVYDRAFMPFARRYTRNPRGITLLQRMGTGMFLQQIVMIIACLVERKRLSVVRTLNLFGEKDTLPLTIFVLLPRFALMGVADNFLEVAKIEFFYDQAPKGMKSLGTSFFCISLGIGHLLSSFLLQTVSDITKRHGRGWVLNNLNMSRLDYYYAFLAGLSFINFLAFLVVAKCFVYNVDVDSKFESQEAMEMPQIKASGEYKQDTTGKVV